MNCFGYCRVSTDEQAVDGVSLEAQEVKLRQWADMSDHPMAGIFTDAGISGKAMGNRPGLTLALDAVCRDKGVLVVYSISRLSRSVRDILQIADRMHKAGAQLASCREKIDTTSAAGRMFFNLMAILVEFERETIAERTKMALDHKRSLGEALGNVPFGFRRETVGSSVLSVPDPVEAACLLEMMRLAEDPDLSFGGICVRLNALGHLSRASTPWERGSVRRIVRYYRTDPGQALIAQLAAFLGARAETPALALAPLG